MRTGLAGGGFPLTLRRHQVAAVEAYETAADPSRCHLVLPPGSGKTLIGAEIARRLGRQTLVLVPNTAIQAQWVQLWRSLAPAVSVAEDRAMTADVTVLTYQAVATFDADAFDGEQPADRLHPDAADLLDRLAVGPPLTLVLDEAHHLAEVWGEVLVELLDRLAVAQPPVVIALTATPRSRLTPDQVALTDRLFGPVLHTVSTPALVREGVLAPFRELVRFVEPAPAETRYLGAHATHWRELTTSLLEPGFASTDFLIYVTTTWVTRVGSTGADAVSWRTIEREHPDSARAVLRLHAGAGLVGLPPGARLREEHRQPPDVTDWAVLIGGYGRTVLVGSDDPRDQEAWERLRVALRSVGWTLTRAGVRRGQSPVDKVLQRTVAKSDAAAQIVHHEAQVRGAGLRAVIVTDFERASATPEADLRTVLAQQAGSAWEALAAVQASDPDLAPVLVTGRTVAGAPATMAALAAFAATQGVDAPLRTEAEVGTGLVTLAGPGWSPRVWLPVITAWFLAGGTRALIGTRGLLGEGWDAAGITTLVDLTAATTTTSVVQVRGRAIRSDPQDPDKAAHIWSVVAISDEHPRGDADYRRFVAKHDGFHAADPAGQIVLGVSHVSPRCGPFRPPDRDERSEINAQMLTAAEDLDHLDVLWGVGLPFEGVDLPVTQVTAPRGADLDAPAVAVSRWDRVRAAFPASAAAIGGVAPLVAGAPAAAGIAGVLLGAAAGWGADSALRRRGRRATLAGLGPDDTLAAMGLAVATAMAGEGAEVEVHPDGAGIWRVSLAGAQPQEAAVFATAMAQLLAPADWPRYLVSRRLPRSRAEIWHAVPDDFGRNRAGAQRFHDAWQQCVSQGALVYTGTPEGAGVLEAVRGLNPCDLTTAVRVEWR